MEGRVAETGRRAPVLWGLQPGEENLPSFPGQLGAPSPLVKGACPPPLASFPDPRKEAGAGLRKKPKALWAGLMVRVTMFPCAFPLPRSVTPGRPALLSGPGSLWL